MPRKNDTQKPRRNSKETGQEGPQDSRGTVPGQDQPKVFVFTDWAMI